MPHLTPSQLDHYRENGYVVAENVLTEAQLATARRETEALVEGAAAVAENDEVYDLEDGHTPERPFFSGWEPDDPTDPTRPLRAGERTSMAGSPEGCS